MDLGQDTSDRRWPESQASRPALSARERPVARSLLANGSGGRGRKTLISTAGADWSNCGRPLRRRGDVRAEAFAAKPRQRLARLPARWYQARSKPWPGELSF